MGNVCRYSVIRGNPGTLLAPSAPQHRRVSLGSRQKCLRVHPGTARLPSPSRWKDKRPQHTRCFPPLPQVNCISTEFTPRKHGGEKGVPFRIQVDTFTTNESGEYMEHVHSSSCQVKVFKVSSSSASGCVSLVVPSMTRGLFRKPKGADRKLKTDREKTDKKSPQDREKYQLSHDTTVLKEVRPHVPVT